MGATGTKHKNAKRSRAEQGALLPQCPRVALALKAWRVIRVPGRRTCGTAAAAASQAEAAASECGACIGRWCICVGGWVHVWTSVVC